MILKKDYILQNMKDKHFADNGNIKVFQIKKDDIVYIHNIYDIITRSRNIEYFTDDGSIYKAKKTIYLYMDQN